MTLIRDCLISRAASHVPPVKNRLGRRGDSLRVLPCSRRPSPTHGSVRGNLFRSAGSSFQVQVAPESQNLEYRRVKNDSWEIWSTAMLQTNCFYPNEKSLTFLQIIKVRVQCLESTQPSVVVAVLS